MFSLFCEIKSALRTAKRSRLIDRARQADEILIGCKLSPQTRQLLQKKRDDLEEQIRALPAM